jgi:hypothetical protein
MVERKVFCDVCKSLIVEQTTTLTLRCGPFVNVLPREMHLCPTDAERFAALIRGGRPELVDSLPVDATPNDTRSSNAR